MVVVDYLYKIKLTPLKGYIKRCKKEHKAQTLCLTFHPSGYRLEITYNPAKDVLLIRTEDGIKRVQLIEAESNLGKGKVLYFLCPRTGKRCRTLYSDGEVVLSRYAFKHTYSRRRLSHIDREIIPTADPYRSRGKMHYRGKLTPYGKRVLKWDKKQEEGMEKYLDMIQQAAGGK